MTILDMLCLSELWTNFSTNTPGDLFLGELTLPGEITNRNYDRKFNCKMLIGCPEFDPQKHGWPIYVKEIAADYVDFTEVK